MALRRAALSLRGAVSQLEAGTPSLALLARPFTTSTAAQLPVHIEDEPYNRQRQVVNLGNRVPTLAPDTWLAANAVVVGDVDLYEKVSVWYGAVLRGDLNSIKVGAFSTIGDRTVVHSARSSPTGLSAATTIGRYGCLLRSTTIEDECVIGDRCILLEGSLVERNSVLAPGSVLPPARRIPSGELWAGAPARFVRKLTKDEKADIPALAQSVFPLVDEHDSQFLPFSFAYTEAEALRAELGQPAEMDGPAQK
eukprot:scaffold18.g1949.t1